MAKSTKRRDGALETETVAMDGEETGRSKRPTRVRRANSEDQARDSEDSARRASPRGRGPRWVIVALGLVALIYLAPWLVGISPWGPSLVSGAVSGLNGRLDVSRVSLGWFVPPTVDGWELKDADGNLVASADRVQLEKSLLSLALDRSDLGAIQVEGWMLDLEVRQGTTNLEEVLAPLLAQESTSPTPRFQIQASEGDFKLRSGDRELRWTQVGLSATSAETDQWNVSIDQVTGADPRERLTIEALINRVTEEGTPAAFNGQVKLEAESFPLSFLSLIAPRFDADWEVEGRGAIELSLEFVNGGERGSGFVPRLLAENLLFSSRELLQGDRIALESVEAKGGISWNGDELNFAATEVRTSIGGGEIEGVVDLGDLSQLWLSAGNESLQSQGEVEVGPVLAMLPRTLRMRDGVQVSRGTLSWTAHSRQEGNGRRLLVDLRSTPLSLINQGETLEWNSPLTASLAIGNSPQGPILEFVTLEAPAVRIDGKGSWDQGELTVQADLQGLRTQLGQIVDFSGTTLNGQVQGGVLWGAGRERTPDGQPGTNGDGIGFGGDLRLTGIDMQTSSGLVWQDPQVDVSFGGRWDQTRSFPESLRPFWVAVEAGSDQLSVTTRQVTAERTEADIAVSGRISRWLARAGIAPRVAGHEVDGELVARGGVAWDRDVIAIQGLDYQLRDARFWGPDVRLREPEVVGQLSASYDVASGRSRIDQGTMAASIFSASLGQFVLGGVEPNEPLGGAYAIRADVAPFLAIFPAWRSSGLAMSGALEGSGAIHQGDAGHWLIQQNATVTDWTLAWLANANAPGGANQQDAVWREPQVTIEFEGDFDSENGHLAIARGSIDGEGQSVALGGEVSLYDGKWTSQLDGELTMRRHDWVALLRPWIGDDAELKGAHSRPVSSRGPVILGADSNSESTHWPPAQLESAGAIAWDEGQVYGIPFGPGELQARLQNQVLDLGTFRLALGDGAVRIASRISFQQATPMLYVDEGRVLEDVQLTPEACRQWLMYTAPIFASATAVRGSVDVDLKASQFPLDDPLKGSGSGTLHVREAAIGPGPMIEQLWGIVGAVRNLGGGQNGAGQLGQWARLPEQDVAFRMQNGRVYHERLQASVGDVVWYTTGSVGHDQSLDMVAVVPIQDAWLANRPNLAALKGVEIRVPIRGTLTRPQLDGQVVSQLARDLARRAAGELLDQQIQRGLGRLFGGDK
ncbi:MAG: hypothetical protein KDA83_01740 [Planctomycetales bacterium]|nr:hypothetical protein [Planctomycetales bacterium]